MKGNQLEWYNVLTNGVESAILLPLKTRPFKESPIDEISTLRTYFYPLHHNRYC